MANNTYYKFLLINLITIFSVFSHIHAQGLQFYGNQNSIEQRTTYIPFNDKEQLPVFYDCIDIEFDLRISQENTFGYLLHMSNSEDPSTTYILTYSYAKDNESVFRFNTEGQINHTSISLSNDSILSHWLPVKLHIDFSLGESIMSIGNHTVKGNIKTIKQSHKFHPFLVFGRREHLVDVPEFAIRKLKISDKKQNYTFLLNESNGNDVHDTKEKIQGKVINPYWLINDSYHWQKVATFSSQGCMGTNFNEQQQKIQFITPDSLFTYNVSSKKIEKGLYANPIPVSMRLGTNFINKKNDNIYAYEVNNLPKGSVTIAALNTSTLTWTPIGKAFTKVQLHHHNGFWNFQNGQYTIFGGFGNKRYNNTFLTYNELTDQWDTLQFKGDRIPPRFYSSTASSLEGNDLYIYGGVGNESGEQEIGHYYYNDLYKVDLTHQTVKKCWSHATKENQVSSRQMILSKDEKSLYVIRYAEYIKKTYLQLYSISIKDGNMEQLGDSIPFTSGSIASTVSLFHNPKLNEFYCVIQEFNEQAKQVNAAIYTLNTPPVSKADIEYYSHNNQRNNNLFKWTVFFLVLLIIVFVVFIFIHKKRKNKNITSTSPVPAINTQSIEQQQDSVELTKNSDSSSIQSKRNIIYIYGTFTIYNRNGRDISYLFSKKLKHLFLYLLLNSSNKEEGVNSSSLNEIFWPDKPEDKAKNLKGVTISNLRKILLELDGIKLVYNKGVFRIETDPSICYCDYFELCNYLSEHPQENETLLKIWERGKLLEHEENPLYDKYKQKSENAIFSLLSKEMPSYYQQNDYSHVLRICHIILKRDPLNEQALQYCIHTYKKINDLESIYKVYSTFIIEYRKCMGQNYAYTIEELLEKEVDSFSV